MQTARMTEQAARYLIFRMGAETFGVDVMQVREISAMQRVTALPHGECGMKGVINLRGRVVPVVDLRMKLGGSEAEATAKSSLLVMCGGKSTTAMVVDEVLEVSGTVDDVRVLDAEEMP